LRFLPAVELPSGRVLRWPALQRRQRPFFDGPLAHALDQARAHVERLGNPLVRPARPRGAVLPLRRRRRPFVRFQQDASARQLAGRRASFRHQCFERLPLVGGQSYAMGFHPKA